MLRRIVLIASASAAVLTGTALAGPASAASGLPVPLPVPVPGPLASLLGEQPEDRLTVVVSETGNPRTDGRYELDCSPAGAKGALGFPGGTHPAGVGACARLDEMAREGENPFAPVPRDALCTQQAGGPATARVTGTWQGQRVDSTFTRQNGCEISRWNLMRPILPSAGA
ncbi:SSI family serine proteinase inhibitor [Streptomyces sp. NPDC048057]|uniref:SSI family serine proteinase inhibitor n=1 Tax=Streptomyces sp. NPDC048057 TaxID=3155628 RepID=UPI0033F512D1